ncbi:tropomyosin-like [Palaemon carinicauda]|uniref:tropomyosin-like n=1 Tax=Palaemon carinicauda TaxID=392227 RepID=UPI0035B61A93
MVKLIPDFEEKPLSEKKEIHIEQFLRVNISVQTGVQEKIRLTGNRKEQQHTNIAVSEINSDTPLGFSPRLKQRERDCTPSPKRREQPGSEASQKDLSEELDGAEEGIELFDDFFARIHQETETTNDLQRICEEVHDAEAGEIELSKDNIAISAINEDLDRAHKKIESLMVSLEKAETRNDQIRDELLTKAVVENELENAHEEIRILEKRLERVAGDLLTANEKLLEKSDLEEYVESADNEIRTLWAELDSVKAENKRVKTENVLQKAALESELNAAVEEVYRIGTKLDTALDENRKLKTELLIKKDVVCDLEMAEEELDKLWKEVAGVKAENRRLKRGLSEERANRNTLMKADEKNKTLEEEIRNLTSVADEFAIYKEKYQAMMERNMNLEMELNNKNFAITQLVEGLSQTHPELKELY